jgi:hypothetical protein
MITLQNKNMTTANSLEPVQVKLSNLFHGFLYYFHQGDEKDNVSTVVFRILKNYKTKVTLTSVIEYLKSHPNFPSLKCICDFFNDVNILNYALRLDETDLYNLSDPFIAHVKESGGKVLMVYSIDKENVIYSDSLVGRRSMSAKQFLEKWDGVVILIEPTEFSGEADFNERRKDEIINSALLPSAIILFSLSLFYGILARMSLIVSFPGTNLLALVFMHLAGLVFSLLLLRHELNLKTKFTDKLCHIATNADCDAVTKSKASKIFGSITWADAGLAYFAGGLISFFLLPVDLSLNILSIFTIVALPYPVFSILYQWLKIKKWCPLCLSVQFVLLLESFIAVNILQINELSIISFIPVVIMFSITFLIVLLFKFLFISDREKERLKLESLKMKRDPEVFLFKLNKGERIDIPTDECAFIFGDSQSKVLISAFLSFHCGACAKRFESILDLISHNYNVKVQLIFSPAKDEISVRFMKSIFSLFKSDQKNKALEELNKWYKSEMKTRSTLPILNKINGTPQGFEDMVNYNSSLFRFGNVVAVPSVYVNGYLLPDTYSLEDIRYHIHELEKMKKELIETEVNN